MSERDGLGRREPTDWRHLLRYGLTDDTRPRTSVPVPIGINWYSKFDRLSYDDAGRPWLVRPGEPWGYVRGGHEVCLKPPRMQDRDEWWERFDQGLAGACVGFAVTRMKTLLERKTFNPWWLYQEAQKVDEWPGENYEGTSGRAAGDVLAKQGHKRWEDGAPVRPGYGIAVYRWARSVEDIAFALDPRSEGRSVLNAGYVTVLNSWGASWPHHTFMDLDTLDRLVYREYGDAMVVTDR